MSAPYRADLAHIHDSGFGHLARGAAALVVARLAQAGIRDGRVVELGCGSGISARVFADAGYSVTGIDLSEDLVALARERVPQADFHVGSFIDAALPACVAVTAIGEVLSYAFDARSGASARRELFERVYAALGAGGLLLFDVATAARVPAPGAERSFVEGPDWVVLVEVSADERRSRLERRITSFRGPGEVWRRDVEVHELMLLDPADVQRDLERAGFRVEVLDRYGAQPQPRGIAAFLAAR